MGLLSAATGRKLRVRPDDHCPAALNRRSLTDIASHFHRRRRHAAPPPAKTRYDWRVQRAAGTPMRIMEIRINGK
jgi:hypothetical protein